MNKIIAFINVVLIASVICIGTWVGINVHSLRRKPDQEYHPNSINADLHTKTQLAKNPNQKYIYRNDEKYESSSKGFKLFKGNSPANPKNKHIRDPDNAYNKDDSSTIPSPSSELDDSIIADGQDLDNAALKILDILKQIDEYEENTELCNNDPTDKKISLGKPVLNTEELTDDDDNDDFSFIPFDERPVLNKEPLVQNRELEPLVQSRDLEPLVQNRELEPLVQNRDLEPLVQEIPLNRFIPFDERPVLNKEPLVQNRELEPLVQSRDLEPLVQNRELEPLVQSRDLEPLIQEIPLNRFIPFDERPVLNKEPLVQNRELEPLIQNRDLEPLVQNRDLEPLVQNRELEPLVQNRELEPLVQSRELEPLVQSRELEPLVQSRELEPLVQSRDLEPLVQNRELEPLVQSRELEPLIQNKKLEILVQELVPVVEVLPAKKEVETTLTPVPTTDMPTKESHMKENEEIKVDDKVSQDPESANSLPIKDPSLTESKEDAPIKKPFADDESEQHTDKQKNKKGKEKKGKKKNGKGQSDYERMMREVQKEKEISERADMEMAKVQA